MRAEDMAHPSLEFGCFCFSSSDPHPRQTRQPELLVLLETEMAVKASLGPHLTWGPVHDSTAQSTAGGVMGSDKIWV